MIEILRLSDLTKAAHYPKPVVDVIRQAVDNLNTIYGENRTPDGDGGVEWIAESEDELKQALQTLPFGDMPESAELLPCGFIRAVYLLDNDRSIDLFLPKEWATKMILEVLERCNGSF